MTRTKYSDEFKEQVVREILEKERTIASVAASYDLVPQTVGVWVAKRRRRDAEAQDPEAAAESAEIARLKAENRELRTEMRVLEKNGCLLRERTSVSERHRAHPPRRRQLPRRIHVRTGRSIEVRPLATG